MVALTCDFNVFPSRVTASFAAVFFSARYIAKTRYMRALFRFLIRHCDSVLSSSEIRLLRLLQLCGSWRSAVLYTDRGCFEGILKSVGFSASTSSRTTACSSPNVAMPLSPCDRRLFGWRRERTRCPECQQADSDVGIWTDLNRVRVLWSRRRLCDSCRAPVTTYEFLFPKPCTQH